MTQLKTRRQRTAHKSASQKAKAPAVGDEVRLRTELEKLVSKELLRAIELVDSLYRQASAAETTLTSSAFGTMIRQDANL